MPTDPTTLVNWDSFNRRVQSGMVEGQFLNAAYMLIAAGPPFLEQLQNGADLSGGSPVPLPNPEAIAYPMGVVQTVNMSHNRSFTRLWELGSEFSVFVPGRTVGQLNLGRVMYYGPSLLRIFYAYYGEESGDIPIESMVGAGTNANRRMNPHQVRVAPGYGNIWWNLASDIFAQPMGILLYLRDSNKTTVGAAYLEYCHVPSHSFATDAQGTILQEMAMVQFERVRPVNVASVPLIIDDSDSIITQPAAFPQD